MKIVEGQPHFLSNLPNLLPVSPFLKEKEHGRHDHALFLIISTVSGLIFFLCIRNAPAFLPRRQSGAESLRTARPELQSLH